MGIIFDLKKFAIHDGPGIRTTVFFKGCPLSCWWCHNPEGQSFEQELMFEERKCRGCGACLQACAQGAISMADGSLSIDKESCTLCGACVEACHPEALRLIGREVTAEEVMEEIERDRIFYDSSGGGATFSGGEPLSQPEFLHSLLRACKAREIHTTVDTSGYAPWEVLREIAADADLFLYDLKLMDDGEHRKFTGVSNELILENLRLLSEAGGAIIVRVPIVPEVNDDEAAISRIGQFLASLPTSPIVDILPYHRVGTEKYRRLSRLYRLRRSKPLADGELAAIARTLRELRLCVTIGGEPDGPEREGRSAAAAEPRG